jgi:multimeric flavodoxin WrbA
MKVLVLTGSPHPHGTTAFLADEFCLGAVEAGHKIVPFNTAKLNIHSCIGCYHCRNNDGDCIYDDDMMQIYPHLLSADVVVLVTPLYYFGMTSQLKAVIDRFFAFNTALREKSKKLCLIAAGSDTDDWAMDGIKEHINSICRYLGWKEGGMVLAFGASTKEDAESSEYRLMAKNLGKTL